MTAARVAIAGNVIDFGINGGITEEDLHQAIKKAFAEPLAGQTEEFRDAVRQAKKILYLADNAGEIVFDRLLIEQLSAASRNRGDPKNKTNVKAHGSTEDSAPHLLRGDP